MQRQKRIPTTPIECCKVNKDHHVDFGFAIAAADDYLIALLM
jgi:hypothetical protein